MARRPKLPADFDGFLLDEKTAHKRKRHAVLIADAIHHSTLLDIQIGATLAFLLGIDAGPALAMYESVRNATAQTDTIRAAIKAVLGDDDAKLFSDVLQIASVAQKDRHRFSHWMWGYYPNDPDKKDLIFMVEPEMGLYAWQAMASAPNFRAIMADGPLAPPKLRKPIASHTYSVETLKAVVARIVSAIQCVVGFSFYAHLSRSGDPREVAIARQWLLALPAIAELHKSREQVRRSKPTAPQPPRLQPPAASPRKSRKDQGRSKRPPKS